MPGMTRVRLKRGCELVRTGTDTLLIPIKTSTAVVELRPCRDDVRLRGGMFRPLGLPVDQLRKYVEIRNGKTWIATRRRVDG